MYIYYRRLTITAIVHPNNYEHAIKANNNFAYAEKICYYQYSVRPDTYLRIRLRVLQYVMKES